jgi:hypothetical protein
MPIVSPLFFYPWRGLDFLKGAWEWLRLILRYKSIQRRVRADPSWASYTDASPRPSSPKAPDQFVQDFAEKIPATYGAPRRVATAS